MATLGELQRLFSIVVEEEQRYWSDLTELVDRLHVRLGSSLGVDSTVSELMAIGLLSADGRFRKMSANQLKRVDRNLEFAVQVILSTRKSLVPPNVLVSEWLIKQTSDGIQLSNKAGGHASVFVDVEDVAAHIVDVFEVTITSFSPYVTK